MSEQTAVLSKKDKEFRDFSLNGNMWRVILYVSIPLAAYQGLTQLFRILDTVMASHISTSAVSAVSYISQINSMLSALGGGLAIGAGIKISEAFGAGDFQLVKKRISTIYALCSVIGAVILACIIPFSESFLRLNNTPEALIAEGNYYFVIELSATVISFFNTVYISVERARGNSRRILLLNIVVLTIKFTLTAFFIYIMDGDIVTIAFATLISQAVLMIFAIVFMHNKNSAFGFSAKAISLKKTVFSPMITKSVPVIAEKAAFSYGKLIINSMSTVYGDSTVGALGISNNIGGIATSLQNGFMEGGAAVISQNIGAGNRKRAIDAFRKTLIINIFIGAFFMLLTLWQIDFISGIFSENDYVFKKTISDIYKFEAFGAVTLGINAAVMALLYGFGFTKLTLILNAARVFVFRIPVLWYLQNFTDMGSSSVGAVMMISNISVGLCSAVAAIIVINKIKSDS